MKILIVSPFESEATGRGDRNMRLEKKLRSRGHDVTFVTSNFDHARKAHIAKKKLADNPNLKVIHVPGYQVNVGIARMLCHLIFALKLWFWAVRTRWDAVVVSSVPPEALLASTLLRRRSLIVDIRDIWPDALQAYGRPSRAMQFFAAYCRTMYRVTLRRADRIMFVAPGFRSWLVGFGAWRPGRVKFVPLGFRREDFRPLSEGSSTYDFCYAGGATPQFDIREFAPEFDRAAGVVLGSGPLLDDWKQIFSRTEFRGPVPRSEAMAVMAKARQLLFPSNPFAQLPNKAFDYFALGHRVVLGAQCSQATRFLLTLRWRSENPNDSWKDYEILEKEAITARAVGVVESASI